MKKFKIVLALLVFTSTLSAQTKELTFPIVDGSYEYLTMKQTNELFFSASQLFYDSYFSTVSGKLYDTDCSTLERLAIILPEALLDSLFFTPLTHEEGHRSILTANNIGAVSSPIFKPTGILSGAAYVKGVSDSTLKNFRDTQFADFIRLHTAGIESEYSLMQKEYKQMVLNMDSYNTYSGLPSIFIDYVCRLASITGYTTSSIFAPDSFSVSEEKNELERDIVGHDIYGMIHHLYHPNDEYHRYYNFSDLSEEEQKYAKNIAYKSFLNFPFLLYLNHFFPTDESEWLVKLGNNFGFNISTGYCLAPFGDYIDENVLMKIDNLSKNPIRIALYVREQKNKNNWFPAFGMEFIQIKPWDFISFTGGYHLWWQSKDLDFNTSESEFGGAVELKCNLFLPSSWNSSKTMIKDYGLSFGILYKTKGYMQEVMSLNEDFVFTAGICLRY